jgi:hypothetical protein
MGKIILYRRPAIGLPKGGRRHMNGPLAFAYAV